MSRPRLLLPKTLSKRKSYCNSIIYVWPWQSIKSLVASTFSFWVQNHGKIWWLKKVQYLKKKYHCKWTLLRGEKPKWIFHNFGNLLQPLEFVPASREHVFPTEWQVRAVLGDCISRAKVISVRAPQYQQYALISDFLDLAKSLATNWINGFKWKLILPSSCDFA